MSRCSARGCRIVAIAVVLRFVNFAFAQEREASDSLVVHEWGTFTSLQDELGNAVGGINSDDEPVPAFVHRVSGNLIVSPRANISFLLAKSVPLAHPDVTMRLETPVVYFHPPRRRTTPLRVNVEVAFPAGWLSEFYPQADVDAPGVKGSSFGSITSATLGQLNWNDLAVGTDAAGPETTEPVWLAPRTVDAANVTATGGESERFLFYRGVGHVDSPLRVSQDAANKSLVITANSPVVEASTNSDFVIPAMWLVDVRQDGALAFRELESVRVRNDGRPQIVATTPAKLEFDFSNLDADELTQLSSSIHTALIEDGLNADEADALLNTWKASYFQSPGLRLFYLLPREWTDHVLPMKLSVDAKLVRTMIGRVEIVTPAQRDLLGQIAAGPTSKPDWQQQNPLSCAAPSVPADYRAYQSLGRFRNALVLDELKTPADRACAPTINNYSLAATCRPCQRRRRDRKGWLGKRQNLQYSRPKPQPPTPPCSPPTKNSRAKPALRAGFRDLRGGADRPAWTARAHIAFCESPYR